MSEEIKKTENAELSEQELDNVAGGGAPYKCPGPDCPCKACVKKRQPSKPNLA